MPFRSLLIDAASPMKRLRRRVPFLEKLIQVPLTDPDFYAIKIACDRSHVRFGAFYHWYLQKLVISRHVRRLKKQSTLKMVTQVDRTDYAPVDVLRDDPRGLIIATPHHGHYILSIVALVEHLRKSREVLVFYGAPQTHAGNELFDHLYVQLWGDPTSKVRILHDNRAGMIGALKGLQNGAVVVIMPDVYKNEHDTFLIPFCGRPLNVMLGTAALARKTRSAIMPMVSLPSHRGLGFNSVFGNIVEFRLESEDAAEDESEPRDIINSDYRIMVQIFREFEKVMDGSIVYWQFVRAHYMREAIFPELSPDSLKVVADLFFTDPRIKVDLESPLRLS